MISHPDFGISAANATRPALRTAEWLTILAVILAALAALGGLLIPGLYRDPATITPALRGQDLVTLLALPCLAAALFLAHHGSPRAHVVWLGLLGYLLYTYTGAAMAYHFNPFFPFYVALFALAVFGMTTVVAGLDVTALHRHFDDRTPRRPVAAFLLLIALMLAAVEVGEIAGFYRTGQVPAIVQQAGTSTSFVYVLDLGIIVPLSVLGSIWLWQKQAWGDLVAGVLLIKAASMGLALLSMNWFALRAGLHTDGLVPLWSVIAMGGMGLGVWFLRHCRGRGAS